MEKITLFSAERVRALGRSILIMFLLAVPILGAAINPVVAAEPLKEDVYPGAIDYKKGSADFFDCDEKKVIYHYYRTTDTANKAVEFYKKHGFTVIRDDSFRSCCISKDSYILSSEKKGATVYVSIENWWSDKENHLMNDTLILHVIAAQPDNK
ncbi:MAG TPA: hypothetical protein DCP92_20485 [Nitrospiraceae bacterium]|jgi:hypothetical protein|nr:hypothetical protein [Nitrospiraceae bacterium]